MGKGKRWEMREWMKSFVFAFGLNETVESVEAGINNEGWRGSAVATRLLDVSRALHHLHAKGLLITPGQGVEVRVEKGVFPNVAIATNKINHMPTVIVNKPGKYRVFARPVEAPE